MPGGPKECRRHAARCAELTVAARTPQSRTTFLGLPKNWEKLAIQLEDAFAKRTESEAIRSRVQGSLDEVKRLCCLGNRVPLFVSTLNGRRTRVNELLPRLMSLRGNFIKRWNPNGWTWRPVPRSSSVWTCSSKPRNFAAVYLRLICVPTVMDECCLRPSIQPLSLKSTSSDADVVAPSIRDVLALMTSRVDGACGPRRNGPGGVWNVIFALPNRGSPSKGPLSSCWREI